MVVELPAELTSKPEGDTLPDSGNNVLGTIPGGALSESLGSEDVPGQDRIESEA